jgi:GNAT superfamily N-acetyltransferase
MGATVRAAQSADAGLIFAFVQELAEYEKLSHVVKTSPDDLATLLFGPRPSLHCLIAEDAGEAVGFALWFYNVSSFEGRGLYLEDLFVRPQARGQGAGRALLAALAKICADEGLRRMEWTVLDWNTRAIEFYDSLGARPMKDWILTRLSGPALRKLAES